MQNKDTDIAERNDCSTGSPWDRIYLSLNSRSLSATHLVASEIASSGRTLHLQATHKSGKGAIFPSQKQCRFEYLPVKRSRSILLLFADFWYMFLVYAAPTCNVCIANYVLVWIDLRWWGDDNSKMWILLVHSHTVRSTFIIGHRPFTATDVHSYYFEQYRKCYTFLELFQIIPFNEHAYYAANGCSAMKSRLLYSFVFLIINENLI